MTTQAIATVTFPKPGPTVLHANYVLRRHNELRAMMHHVVGTLLVVGALYLLANG